VVGAGWLLFLLLLELVFVKQPATSPGVQHLDHSLLAGAPVRHGRWQQWEGTGHRWLVRAAVRAAAAVTRHRCHRHRVGAVVFVLLLLLILSLLCLLLLLLLLFELVYVRSQ
jgi:hypothetical protein